MYSIFIIDDDHSIATLLQLLFEELDYKVIGIASNGQIAINKFKNFSEKPDIILMDYRMPIKNGIEATKEILQINNSTKIIFASADKSVRSQAMSVGAISFLEKPFSIKKLVNEINRVLRISMASINSKT